MASETTRKSVICRADDGPTGIAEALSHISGITVTADGASYRVRCDRIGLEMKLDPDQVLRQKQVTDPFGDPALLLLPEDLALPVPQPDRIVVRGGTEAGLEGRWLGPGGLRRGRGGITVETGLVSLDDGRTLAIPIGELERFAALASSG